MINERNARTQEMLKAEGLYKGKIDGIIGPLTRKALELHNKQQYQPLPVPRPAAGAIAPSLEAGPPGGPGAEAAGQLPLLAGEEASDAGPDSEAGEGLPPMPDSSAFINAPEYTYGGPKTESAMGLRDLFNNAVGHEVLTDPNRPAYVPGFTGEASPPPMAPVDQDLSQMLPLIAKSLGGILSRAVR
jgi:hypothetical protein